MSARKFEPEEFSRMWLAGASLNEIKDRFGYASGGAVSGVVSRLGLPKRNPVGEVAQRDADIREEFANGVSVEALMKDYALARSTVQKILRDYRSASQPSPSTARVRSFSCAQAAIDRYITKHGVQA